VLGRRHRTRRLADYIKHHVGVRQHGYVARCHFRCGGFHALRDEALQVGMNGLVLIGKDIPARFGLPCRAVELLVEQVGHRHALRCVHKLLVGLRQVSAEVLGAGRLEPHATVSDFDLREDRGRWEFVELALGGLVGIGRQRSDIDEPDHARVNSRVRDQRAAVGVADEDRRVADTREARLDRGHVRRKRVETVLRGHHFVALGLKRGDELPEASAVGPEAMGENDAGFCHYTLLA
jgi:hypothetical protein